MDNTHVAGRTLPIGVNIFLAGLKLGLAIPTISLALGTDAVHSLTDITASGTGSDGTAHRKAQD